MSNINLSSRNGQFQEFQSKTVLEDSDILLIEDSSDDGAKKALPLSVLYGIDTKLDLNLLDFLKELSEDSNLFVQVGSNKYKINVGDLLKYIKPIPVKDTILTTDVKVVDTTTYVVIKGLPSASVYVKKLNFYISESYNKSLDSYIKITIHQDKSFSENSILREFYDTLGCSFLNEKITAPAEHFIITDNIGFKPSLWITLKKQGVFYPYKCGNVIDNLIEANVDLNFESGCLISNIFSVSDFTYQNKSELTELYLKFEILDGSLEPHDLKIETTVLPFGG